MRQVKSRRGSIAFGSGAALAVVLALAGCGYDRNADFAECPFSPADRGCYGNCKVLVRDAGPVPPPVSGAWLPSDFCTAACGRVCDPVCGEDSCALTGAGDGSIRCFRQCASR